MKKNQILIILLMTTLIMLISTICFFQYHVMPKQAKIMDDLYAENFIGVNRAWIDIYNGKVNLTEEDLQKIETILDGIEERLKNE